VLFKNKMEQKVPAYLGLIERNFNDKDVDTLIEHFRDPERRKEFFKEYKEVEMLYEIISPDAFLRPYIDDYATLSAIYRGGAQGLHQARGWSTASFQRKTNALVQEHVGTYNVAPLELVEINERTIELIKKKLGGDGTKVINLIKSIEKKAEESSDDPFLIAMAERAKLVQEGLQKDTAEALADLLALVQTNEDRKKEQAEKGFDGLTFFTELGG
jgi:type I restriction enzyme R subunit